MNPAQKEARKKSKQHLRAMSTTRHRRIRNTRRVVKYGASSFARNLWLTIAATLIMTVALLVISVTLIARNIMMDTVAQIKDNIDISVFLVQDAPEPDITKIMTQLRTLSSVKEVWSISPDQAKEELSNMKTDNPAVQDALRVANNKFLWTIHVKLFDYNDLSELDDFIAHDSTIQEYQAEDADLEQTMREAITNIGAAAALIEKVGLIAGAIFVIIAALIIFNTIRMAIFNRREEIEMMKLIGAEKSFIRGPFLVEATFYGVIAAAITTGAIWIALTLLLQSRLESYGLVVAPTIELITHYWWVVIPALLFIGIFIGILSAAIATKKYLRLK